MKFSGHSYILVVSFVAFSTQEVFGAILPSNDCTSGDWPKLVAATCRNKFDVQKAAGALFMDPVDGLTTYCRTFAGFYNCILAHGELCENERNMSEKADGYIKKIKAEQSELPMYCDGVNYYFN